jgi:rSAM/selenodomain-associated transferase 1
MTAQFLVIAKTPEPGRVKTRLCPPCTPEQAALVAAAALADTLDVVDAAPAAARTLLVEGRHPAPPGWRRIAQRGDGLAERLISGYADSARPGLPSVLVGMDTPQLTVSLLDRAVGALAGADAVLGPAVDGGWWALGLRDPADAAALRGVPMSTSDTGDATLAALRARGLRVAILATLRDVDTAADAHAVAAGCPPAGRFARAVAGLVPQPVDQ